MPEYEHKKARYTAFFMSLLVLYVVPSMVFDGVIGRLTAGNIAFTVLYYGFIAFLFLYLKKGHIHFITTALMAAGFIKSVDYFLVPEAYVFYIHSALALIIGVSIHVRKYQLYLCFIIFNALIVLRIPYVISLTGKGVLSSGSLVQTVQALVGSAFITMTLSFLSRIIDREIEKSERLEKIASTDTLTGLLNRRKLEHVFRHPGLSGKKVLLVIDIDFFKKVNDDFGHDKGDSVLVQFSSILSSLIRESDSCYRWGGEEFVAVLRELSLEEAIIISERVRTSVQNADFGLLRPITVSIGLSASLEDREPLESMLARADRAMYRAKNKGRNRVEVEVQ